MVENRCCPTWDEFYDNYMTLTPIKAGSQKRYNYTWGSDASGTAGGGSNYITIVSQ